MRVTRAEPAPWWKRVRGSLVVGVRNRVSEPAARRLPLSLLRRGHRLRRRLRPSRYTDADPFALLDVSPERITRSVISSATRPPQWGRVVGGDWDRVREPFDERAVPRGIEQRFVEGRAWRETALFDAYVEQLARFGNAGGHTSLSGFERRCDAVERLYESMRAEGYKRQRELDGNVPGTLSGRLDEIHVDIGRDGELCWRSYGQHRLAIAKLLGLNTVPVFVHRRHRRWQVVRDDVRESRARENVERANRSHPDLRELFAEAPT